MDHKIKDIVVSILVVLAIAGASYYFLKTVPEKTPTGSPNGMANGKEICENNNGKWFAEFSECENIGGEICNKNGGQFFDCASACRHDPKAEMCTTECVPVCYFNSKIPVTNPLNTTYQIDGKKVLLTKGKAENEIAPGSATKETFSVFGEPTLGDLNSDGKQDAVVIITRDAGGSGTFFYVAIAKNVNSYYIGTGAILLGDRIAPQTLEVKSGHIVVNYADRKPSEPMTARPSVGVSRYFVLNGDEIKEIKSADENVSIISPALYETIKSPLTIAGKARGNYFFEASFPIFLTDWDGKIIATGIAQAKGDWMTADFVPFASTLKFTKPPCQGQDFCKHGALIFKKDNQSGLPEHDAAFEMPIVFE